jgi:cytochrome c oxidase subunit II
MDKGYRLFPEQASTIAPKVDALFFFLCAVSAFFTALIFVLIVYFAIKYRRKSEAHPPQAGHGAMWLEITWSVIPFIITMVIFFWGARLYFVMYRVPRDALEIHVIGKQWMWKLQHPGGQREINTLHVPAGQPVRLVLSSQDVIHSFYVPAFRIKQDAIPGRYTMTWFEATKPGVYHLFCAEYCGTEHSGMIGKVHVMEPDKYQEWLSGITPEDSPVDGGAKLFQSFGCVTCHGVRAPGLLGLYGSRRQLRDGRVVEADENYIRESILDSTAKIVAGYEPIMPSYRSQVSEEQLMHLVAYVKSLKAQPIPAPVPEKQP